MKEQLLHEAAVANHGEMTGPLSIHRGLALHGIGEGPGQPIHHGEQYLAAAPTLAGNGELLAELRPWMTLDSYPEDHKAVHDELEGWSCYPSRDGRWLLVARLISAGFYDRRAAYYSHGLVWETAQRGNDVDPGAYDPGAYLGASSAFAQRWQEGEQAQAAAAPEPLVRPDQVKDEAEVAELLLAHLYQALIGRYPLVIVAPVADFRMQAPLHALVSFARAGLPADLKHRCRIRIYSRQPDLFLDPALAVDLLVLPEESGLAARVRQLNPDAVLLDRAGKVIRGVPADQQALAYARALLRRALLMPRGLVLFSERFPRRRLSPGLPSPIEITALPITYNVGFALHEPAQGRADLLERYLPRAAGDLGPLPWQQLVQPEEWASFPPQSLYRVILSTEHARQPGGQALQQALVQAISAQLRELPGQSAQEHEARQRWLADDFLDGWWDERDQEKLARLLHLLTTEPPLVSWEAGASRTSGVPIAKIAKLGPVAGVLRIETLANVIRRRSGEAAELAHLAVADHDVFAALCTATGSGLLDTGWAHQLLTMTAPERQLALAEQLLRHPEQWRHWDTVPSAALDRLLDLELDSPGLGRAVQAVGARLDPVQHLGLFLRLAELELRLERTTMQPAVPQPGRLPARSPLPARGGELVTRLWQALSQVEDCAVQEQAMTAALDERWQCLTAERLVDNYGALTWPWAARFPGRLLACAGVRRQLGITTLLDLAERLPADDHGSMRLVYQELTAHQRNNLQDTTRLLVESGWWFGWRRMVATDLDRASARQTAAAWLACPVWRARSQVEATLETWRLVITDLEAQPLTATEMAQLCRADSDHRPTWPLITPFEGRQLSDLAGVAADLDSLATLAEIRLPDHTSKGLGRSLAELVLQASHHRDFLPATALLWLIEPALRHGDPPQLDLAQSQYLYDHTQLRRPAATIARVASIADQLSLYRSGDRDPDARRAALAALHAANGTPNLWREQNDRFFDHLVRWLAGFGTVEVLGAEIAAAINELLPAGVQSRQYDTASRLAHELATAGYPRVAELLMEGSTSTALVDQVITALCTGQADHACWQQVLQTLNRRSGYPNEKQQRNPLTEAAHKIRHELLFDRYLQLRKVGWQTFFAVLRSRDRYPLLADSGEPGTVLPAFDLATSMTRGGTMGQIAEALISLPSCRPFLQKPQWWTGLLDGIRHCRRRGGLPSPDDDAAAALALLYEVMEQAGAAEGGAFATSLKRAAERGWPLLEQFGGFRCTAQQ